ncbi:hypothetical protein AGMMS49991_04300 [Spirochaetia bacterium]|nr:hypothetical protein AGMMS49991_04300 [Spirochaetia bacterium]
MKFTLRGLVLFVLLMTLPVLQSPAQTPESEPGAGTASNGPEIRSPENGVTSTTILLPSADLKVEKSEFPLWARDLRRADIIFFGAFPFMYFISSTVIESIRWAQNGLGFDSDSRRYAPWPLKTAGGGVAPYAMTAEQYGIAIGSAFGGAFLVALADYLIVRGKRVKAAREAAKLPPGELIINRSPWPAVEAEEPPPGQNDGTADPAAPPAGDAANSGAP